VTVDNTVGSLAQLAEKLWICAAIREHEVEGQCMDLFKTYVIGKQILDADSTIFLTFANLFNILNLWRATGTGFSVHLQGDCTGRASNAAFNKFGLGVKGLGSHYAPLSFSLIPAQCKSFQAYNEAYRAIKSAARYLISLKLCDRPNCATCRCIKEVRENPKVVAATSTEAYIKGKKLPIAVALCDNSAAWQKFARSIFSSAMATCTSNVRPARTVLWLGRARACECVQVQSSQGLFLIA
jgi:hypothetical protein